MHVQRLAFPALTRAPPDRIAQVKLWQRIEEDLEEDFEEIDAAQVADPAAGWPAAASNAVKELAKASGKCLLHEKDRKRAALPDVLE